MHRKRRSSAETSHHDPDELVVRILIRIVACSSKLCRFSLPIHKTLIQFYKAHVCGKIDAQSDPDRVVKMWLVVVPSEHILQLNHAIDCDADEEIKGAQLAGSKMIHGQRQKGGNATDVVGTEDLPRHCKKADEEV